MLRLLFRDQEPAEPTPERDWVDDVFARFAEREGLGESFPEHETHLIRLVETFAPHVGRSEATVSTWIARHARLFLRLRQGQSCTVRTYQKALIWFAANWPEDAAWPDGVPRPSPQIGEAA